MLPPPNVPEKTILYSTQSSLTLPAVKSLQPAFKYTQPYVTMTTLQNKRKKAKEVTSVGGSTAIARTLMMQGLYLFYRTPVKVRGQFAIIFTCCTTYIAIEFVTTFVNLTVRQKTNSFLDLYV